MAALESAWEISDQLRELTKLATERRLNRAADMLGVDLGSAEGLLAAIAHELVQETVSTGFGSNLPKTVDAARIAGQAAALFEMANPGVIQKVAEGDRAAQHALGTFVQQAYDAFSEGRLRLQDGTIADGWVEVFPQLDDLGRDILDLPGFSTEGYRALGGSSSPHVVESNADDEPRSLPEGVPEIDAEGRPVEPAPEERGLPKQGRPGTWVVGPRGDRLYGPDGKPIKDVDWGHDHGQGQPHTHEWIDGVRQPGRPATAEESFSGDGRGDDGLIRPEDWR
ncbi:hypothetical protein [Paracoccus fistulariae]|uniref:Uncharacterized protein n=1 Tax=Paracoccus fistulariae TaxID=658446 RepID=A0ABY7SJW2_9RHOB|nr:hypothetical protein [Paracoccus fistulariae]MDB6183172.1 hypothetical protein [Paracoccus fistulariae]WCR07303.1 hypothetical protein JHX87_00080 [Paracoccus fistulariae]